jgi:hypothetical protein
MTIAVVDGDAIESHLFATVDETRHEGMGGVLEQMDAHHPEEPHWYLSIVGGTPVVAPMLRPARSAGPERVN